MRSAAVVGVTAKARAFATTGEAFVVTNDSKAFSVIGARSQRVYTPYLAHHGAVASWRDPAARRVGSAAHSPPGDPEPELEAALRARIAERHAAIAEHRQWLRENRRHPLSFLDHEDDVRAWMAQVDRACSRRRPS